MVRSFNRQIGLIGVAVVVALAARTFFLYVGYASGTGTSRYHVESAAVVFLLFGLLRVAISPRLVESEAAPKPRARLNLWVVYCAASVLLYWPALETGFLSEDYGLAALAAEWRIGPVTPTLFRPLPLTIWAALLHLGAGPVALHLLNILLHATVAYLASQVAMAWVPGAKWSLAAGFVVLTSPLAPEAVVWCSGVFDVSATALALTGVLVARRYGVGVTVSTRLMLALIVLAALMSKETAAAAVGLVALDAWQRRRISRLLVVDLAILVGIVGAISVVRIGAAFGHSRLDITKYMIQRMLFESFGGFAVPWHVDFITAHPLLPVVGVGMVLGMLTAFLAGSVSTGRIRSMVGAALWILLSAVAVAPFLSISPDLQASRYLYLGATGWAGLLVLLASSIRTDSTLLRNLRVIAIGGLILLNGYATRVHLRHWTDAAALRNLIESAARSNDQLVACERVVLRRLPDNVRGAYLFRNSVPEAFARDMGLQAKAGRDEVGPCVFDWQAETQTFISASAVPNSTPGR